MQQQNISRYKLQKYTNWNYKRINDFYFGRVKEIKTSEIELLCSIFKCKVADLFEYDSNKHR